MGAVYFDSKVPQTGEVVSSKFWYPFTRTLTVPHTRMHSSTPITEVVLGSDFLVPTFQTTRRHISDDTNPYLKPAVVYARACVCVCVFCEISG